MKNGVRKRIPESLGRKDGRELFVRFGKRLRTLGKRGLARSLLLGLHSGDPWVAAAFSTMDLPLIPPSVCLLWLAAFLEPAVIVTSIRWCSSQSRGSFASPEVALSLSLVLRRQK